MAYSDDISNLGADHHWKFDGNSNDAIGSANGTDTGVVHTGSPIAEDATNAVTFNGRTDRIAIPSTTTINNSAMTRKAMAGWFMVDDVELPTCVIYSEGTFATQFTWFIMPGNSVLFEVRSGSEFQIQVYSDIALAADRAYHLCTVFEGNGYGNIVRFYIDGVLQTSAIPSDREPDTADLNTRATAPAFGDPSHTDVGMNNTDYADDIQSPGDNRSTEQIINAYYQHWCAWGDEADAVLTDTEVRETLFERGALADDTISTGTESAMQTALDAFSATTRADAPCCIEIEAVSGGGDFTLDVDDITFNALASIHIRYNGTADTLTLINKNGSNCSIVSAPFGGTVVLLTEVTVTVTVLDASDFTALSGARVLVEAGSGGNLPYRDSVTITRSGSTATVTHTAHGLVTGDKVLIRGALQQEYNNEQTITVTGVNSYTYTVSGTPTTPATGTITSTAIILSAATNGSGVATTSFNYSADQPVDGIVRSGSGSTKYTGSVFVGTITTGGLTQTVLLVKEL